MVFFVHLYCTSDDFQIGLGFWISPQHARDSLSHQSYILYSSSVVKYIMTVMSFKLNMTTNMFLFVWFVVDEYYCSETTTTQACLGY